MKKQTLALTCIAGLLTGCGGGSISGSLVDQLGAEESQAPAAAAAQPEESNPTPYVEEAMNNASFATIPESETSQIVTTANFLFDTAKSVELRVNIADAVGTQSSISLCTDYEANGSGYSVNYNSCAVKATIQDGQFTHQMELMNQFDSAIAVVWFPDQEFEPMFNELNVADLIESDNGYIWNWN